MMTGRARILLAALALGLLAVLVVALLRPGVFTPLAQATQAAPLTSAPTPTPAGPQAFDGQRAYDDVKTQVELGPRLAGSAAHAQAVEWMQAELRAAGWEVEVQETTHRGQQVRNVVAKWGAGQPWIVLGAHFDTRLVADQEPDEQARSTPGVGANDGASGVAVLLELARVLPSHLESPPQDAVLPGQIWLVFFDAEDNGRIPGWDWILGSEAFVAGLETKPDAAVIIDMIGDADLNIYQERNSTAALSEGIWATAADLGYARAFIAAPKHTILDDHIPFLEAGIPAVDLIDFDYPYWHTHADTLDKVSPDSLRMIGEVLIAWLTQGMPGVGAPAGN